MNLAISGSENYTRTIEFSSPAYLPCDLSLELDWLFDKNEAKRQKIYELQSRFPDDLLAHLDVNRHKHIIDSNSALPRWKDEWGTGWLSDGYGEKTDFYPLSDGYENLDTYVFPDPALPGRFEKVDAKLQTRRDRYTRPSVWFTLFERLWMLRGFDNLLLDPYLEETNFCKLRDQIVEYNLNIIDQWHTRKVHSIFFSDDWGSQRGLLIHPDDWRHLYKPSYKKMFERVRDGGAHVWMHLCGNIVAILPDLIDLGLNVLNPIQPQAMDVQLLSREFGGKVCFYGGIDVQGTLINGTPDDVKKEVHNLVSLLGKFNGGYIAGTSHSIMPETPLDNVIAIYEALLDYQPQK